MQIPAEVDRLIREHRFALAVMRLHELTGMGLSEAKLAVKNHRAAASSRRSGRGRAYSGPPYRLASAFGLFLGSVMIATSLLNAHMALRTGAWPATQGIIEQSETRRVHRDEGTSTELILRYAYEVGDRSYTGSRVGFGKVFTNEGARRAARTYRVGKRVEVYYDPKKPASAVLETGGSYGIYLWLGMGLATLALGLWLRRKAQEADARRMSSLEEVRI